MVKHVQTSWRMLLGGGALMLSTLFPAACQMTTTLEDADDGVPAVVAAGDAASLTVLRLALGDAVGRSGAELGADDPMQAPIASLLPPRLSAYETNSPAMPDVFDLRLKDGSCYAVHRKSGSVTALTGVNCVEYSKPE